MFFLLAGVMGRFHYLKVGLALVLGFVGTKMLLVDLYKIPIGFSLGMIGLILGGAILASWLRVRLLAAEGSSRTEGPRVRPAGASGA